MRAAIIRNAAEIRREAVSKACRTLGPCKDLTVYGSSVWGQELASLAALHAIEMAQADAAALLEPVRMRASDGGVRQ